MSVPRGIVAGQLQSLLERLDRDKDRRCAAEQASAAERVRLILRNARGEARQRMHEAVRYERARLTTALALRRAELEAKRRRADHAARRALLQRACAELPAVLVRRWQDAGYRREWCEAALAASALHLVAADWQIELAPGTSAAERTALASRASELRPGSHALSERAEIAAGLRVRAAGATLDATCDGLLDDLAAIEARLLREWLRSAVP